MWVAANASHRTTIQTTGISHLRSGRGFEYIAPAMPGAYEKAYEESLADPRSFWARAAEDIEWLRRPRAVLDDSEPPMVRWFPGGVLNTCANALDLHVQAGRGDQPALVYDSPVTGTLRPSPTASSSTRCRASPARWRRSASSGRPRAALHADGPRGRDRDAGAARLGAIHSVVFGGFAANELAQRIQHAAPKVVLSASCGIEPGRVVAYKPLLDRAIEMASHKPGALRRAPAPEQEAQLSLPGRDSTGPELAAAPSPSAAPVPSHRSPLHPLHLGHDGHAQGRRARQRWTRRRAQVEPAQRLRHGARVTSSGRPRTSAGSWATPTSSTRRCCSAAPRSSTRASPWARPTRRLLARDLAARGERALHRADRLRAIKREDPRGAAARALRPLERCAPSSWRASAPIPTPWRGASARSASR